MKNTTKAFAAALWIFVLHVSLQLRYFPWQLELQGLTSVFVAKCLHTTSSLIDSRSSVSHGHELRKSNLQSLVPQQRLEPQLCHRTWLELYPVNSVAQEQPLSSNMQHQERGFVDQCLPWESALPVLAIAVALSGRVAKISSQDRITQRFRVETSPWIAVSNCESCRNRPLKSCDGSVDS